MIKKNVFIGLMVLLSSCQYFGLEKKANIAKKPIASVYDAHLYKEDIAELIPVNTAKKDSILLVKSVIYSWAKQQLLRKKAEENLTQKNSQKYTKLVRNYKQGLLVNGYKERLVKQQLDTVISEEEITGYYDLNRQNFRLNEELIKIKYLHVGKDLLDKKEVVKLFRSKKYADLIALEDQGINFKGFNLNDSTWVKVEDVLLKNPKFKEILREKLLKKTKFIQKEDSLGLYLVAVKDVLKRNDIAPLNYITPTIRQMILHKRKLELIREIEKTLINDAIQNQNFKEY